MIVATGRMFQAVRPYLEQAGLEDPVVCYQGAAVVDPRTGRVPAARAARSRPCTQGDRISRRGGAPAELLRPRPALRRRADRRTRAHTPSSSTSLSARSATCSAGSTKHRPSSWRWASPTSSLDFADRSQKARAGRLRHHLAAVPARGRQRVGLEGNGGGVGGGTRRLRRRACGRVRRRRERSRATRPGAASASQSRAVTPLLRERADWLCPGPESEGRRLGDRGVRRLTAVIDLKAARAEPEPWREALARKGAADEFDALLEPDARWRARSSRASTSFAAGRS